MSEQDQNSPEYGQNSEEQNISREEQGEVKTPAKGEERQPENDIPLSESEENLKTERSEPVIDPQPVQLDDADQASSGSQHDTEPAEEPLRVQESAEAEGSSSGIGESFAENPELPQGHPIGAPEETNFTAGSPEDAQLVEPQSDETREEPSPDRSEESASVTESVEELTAPEEGGSLGVDGSTEDQPASIADGEAELESSADEGAEVREEVVDDLAHIIEAIIFASDEPLPTATIKTVLDVARTFGRVHPDMITSRVAALNARYEAEGSGFHIVEIANGYQYATRKEMAQWVSNLFKERSKRRLSNSALETLAIIAYKQPITKPEIESIRGVNVDYVLHNLLEKEVVTVVGRGESVGRPLLYGTTQKFLKIFALKSLEDLPKLREIEEIIKEIKSRGAEESIQLEITALGESGEPTPTPETKQEALPENGTE